MGKLNQIQRFDAAICASWFIPKKTQTLSLYIHIFKLVFVVKTIFSTKEKSKIFFSTPDAIHRLRAVRMLTLPMSSPRLSSWNGPDMSQHQPAP